MTIRPWMFAALLVSTTACKKAADPGTATGGSGAAQVADKAPATAGTPASMSKTTGDDLSLLPVKSELVLGINFAQLQSSALWKTAVAPVLAKNMDMVNKFTEKCGFNPLETVKTITMGVSGSGSDRPEGAMVVHGLDKAKMTDCLVNKMKDEISAKGGSVTQDGDIFVIKDDKGMTSTATFISDDTFLMALDGDKAKLAEYVKGDSALKSSPLFVDMFGKLKTTDSLWGLLRGDSKMLEFAAGLGMTFKAIYGSVNFTDAVNVSLRARMASAAGVASLVDFANAKLPRARMFVDKVDVAADGDDAKLDALITLDKLKGLIALAQMGMGMGGGDQSDDAKPPTP